MDPEKNVQDLRHLQSRLGLLPFLHVHPEQPPVHLDAVCEPGPFHIRLVHAHYPIRDALARIIRFTFSIYDTTQLLQTNNPFLVIPITPVNKLKNLKTKPLYTPQTSIIKNAICTAQHPY